MKNLLKATTKLQIKGRKRKIKQKKIKTNNKNYLLEMKN